VNGPLKIEKMKKRSKIKIVSLSLLLFGFGYNFLFAQTIDEIDPTPKNPQPTTFVLPSMVRSPSYNSEQRTPSLSNGNLSVQERNRSQLNQFERDRQIVEQQKLLLKEIDRETSNKKININLQLPSFSNVPETKYYQKAFKKLCPQYFLL